MEVKSVATFSVILVKLATPPLPPQTKLNFEQMGGMTAFLDTTLLEEGEWGDDGMYQKEIKKLSLGAESYITITWKGFFTQPN